MQKQTQKIITINHIDYRGAGVSKTLPPDHEVITKTLNEMRREATLKIDGTVIGKVQYIGKRTGLPHGRRWNWYYDRDEVDKLRKELGLEGERGKTMTKTVYIAGMPEAEKDNGARIQELGNMLREGGYAVTGREQKEPWQMTKEDFAKTAVPIPDRKDFIKAWLKDNEDIPDLVTPGFNYIEQRNGSLLVFGNQRGQAIGIISFRKDAVEHIAVSDRYKDRGIATQLLEESRKYGVRRIYGQVSPEVAGIAHRFTVKTAFLEGKPIPQYVLREYPDLMMKAEKQKWRRTV